MTSHTTGQQGHPRNRQISGPLMLGLLTVPLVFGWFLARKGYARSTRVIVAIYALLAPTIAILDTLG
ncbi:hypothetical protein [Sphingomonas metalli]|uniref:hypothetical protein n=1 Tax=Sphingomonas metalli TaxID=1779358 RepID=UPI00166D9968|nr:hypothetical protein [Sphingomonas metalli]